MLTIQNESQSYGRIFSEWEMCSYSRPENCQNPGRMGNMLLKSNLITEEQLNDALDRQKRTNQPLGYILINSGYISREKLKGAPETCSEKRVTPETVQLETRNIYPLKPVRPTSIKVI